MAEGNSADEILVGANGAIWIGEKDSEDLPDDVATDIDDDSFTNLGFVSEEGAKFLNGKTVTGIPVWQSFYDARKIVSARVSSIAFALRQWSGETVPFALGGGVIETNGEDEFVYTPPQPEDIDEHSLILEYEDGDKKYRIVFPRGLVTENVESQIVRTAAADLPIVFEALSDGTTDPFTIYTNDPSFEAAASSSEPSSP